ncbi:MAG: CHAT domain-containing protein, partial [Terriglobales bacterium]
LMRTSRPKTNNKTEMLLAGLKDFDSAKTGLPSLQGALDEVTEIKPLADQTFSKVDFLTEQRALKSAVKAALPTVAVAHFATHGFATGDSSGSGSGRSRSATIAIRAGDSVHFISAAKNPLLECGLYFAFPSDWKGGASELPNVLTAEEIVGLDLSGCNHVTLSACQTGLGQGLNGQGVLGLRSAILSAGARSILMSLWSIDDESTRALMKRFYTHLWQDKMPKVEALAKAQQEIRANPRWSDPKYWAGWVLAGDGWN